MKLTSPLFASGTHEFENSNWASGLFQMMAIAQSFRMSGDDVQVPCDGETLDLLQSNLSETPSAISRMVGAVAQVLQLDEVPPRVQHQLGYLIEGLCEMQEEINAAADWTRSQTFNTVADPQCLFECVRPESSSNGAPPPEIEPTRKAKRPSLATA